MLHKVRRSTTRWLAFSMVFVLGILAIGMVATGLAAIVFGMSIVQVERGWTMVISGAVGASGGAVLLGIAFCVQRLGRIATELVWIRDRLATIGEMTAESASWNDQAASETEPETESPVVEPPPAEPEHQPEPVQPQPVERVIVGQYASGGNEYKMFSDGSIDAMTPAGLRRFASLEDLRAFVAGGGERPQP